MKRGLMNSATNPSRINQQKDEWLNNPNENSAKNDSLMSKEVVGGFVVDKTCVHILERMPLT